MGVGADGALRHLYWGAPLWRADDLAAPPTRRDISSFDPRQMLEAEEFPGWGGPRYYEPALKITREDGNRDLVLRYVSHRIRRQRSRYRPEGHQRRHRSHPALSRLSRDYGILRRSATIRNATPRAAYRRERAIRRLEPAARRGLSAHLPHRPLGRRNAGQSRANPRRAEGAREPQGPHQPQFQSVVRHRCRRCRRRARPRLVRRARLERQLAHRPSSRRPTGRCASPAASTPSTSLIRSSPASPSKRRPSTAASPRPASAPPPACCIASTREQILPGGATSRLRPVLYNSWEATDLHRQRSRARRTLPTKAAKLGVELFVMDDGWFGARNNDHAGLGDWTVNPQKFPQGLKGLIDHVNSLAWISASGSSPKWSTPIATSTAHIPTGSSTSPTARAANCATR